MGTAVSVLSALTQKNPPGWSGRRQFDRSSGVENKQSGGHVPGMTYRVKVVQSSGGPKLWHWEIHKDGNPIFAQRSLQGFATPEEASQAGEATRQRLEDTASLNKGN
jgi:hypothetical protein